MANLTLADGLRQAGSPMNLLWKPGAPPAEVPVVPPEINGWREEQRAWEDGVALFDLSHHMFDTSITGKDALRLLSFASANSYERFAIGQAKQFIAVGHDGYLLQDGIVLRFAEDEFALIGIQTIHDWVSYLAKENGYDVALRSDPPSDYRDGPPPQFRFQVQGPRAMAVLEIVFGSQLEGIGFFRFREIEFQDRKIFALRHGMAGQAGFELFGPWDLADGVRDALQAAGEPHGIVQVGGLAYYSSAVDSGWFATPVPAIYTQARMSGFRDHVSLFSYEGQAPLQGSYYSPNIADYYRTPFELGYGRSISFNHDFLGREALMARKSESGRVKVTLVWDADDVKRVFGADHGFLISYSKDRVEMDGRLVGTSEYMTFMDPAETVHSLALVDATLAEPGTAVTVVWGQHPGPGAPANPTEGFEYISAIVAPSPFSETARTAYRGRV